ncbi:hypothetical protein CLV42_11670 [Chitinophaga ginsengisoli]|uniref:Uncharacterized protein n=1 Tax=Chitinophaga ginsengisoli TaxID=363837 RepID=A0A2P8FQT7_9BACT|nr:hypothetical protein CLV42_11670 [Chitinophaga ginsengisoli]
MNGRVFKTLKKRACFARFLALSTCRNEDKKISQFTNMMLKTASFRIKNTN